MWKDPFFYLKHFSLLAWDLSDVNFLALKWEFWHFQDQISLLLLFFCFFWTHKVLCSVNTMIQCATAETHCGCVKMMLAFDFIPYAELGVDSAATWTNSKNDIILCFSFTLIVVPQSHSRANPWMCFLRSVLNISVWYIPIS